MDNKKIKRPKSKNNEKTKIDNNILFSDAVKLLLNTPPKHKSKESKTAK